MKAISIVLLVIGVVSAVPLKAPRKTLQDLISQENLNTILQQIQQNQDLFQTLINNHPAQWLPSQGFSSPRFGVKDIKSLFRNSDLQNFNFEGFLGSLNTEQLSESFNFQQYFSNEILKEVFSYIFQYPLYSSTAISFLGSLNINIFQVWSELVSGSFNLNQYLTEQTTNAAFEWISENPDAAIDLGYFYVYFLPMDQVISTLIKTINYLLSKFASFYLGSSEQLSGSNYQQVYQQLLESINYEPVHGEIDIQYFLESNYVFDLLYGCITNIDEAQTTVSFLTSLGLNFFYVVGNVIAGTFDPEQFFTSETAFAALQWTNSHPNEVPELVNFLMNYLPYDQFEIFMWNTITNLAPILSNILWPNLFNNLPRVA